MFGRSALSPSCQFLRSSPLEKITIQYTVIHGIKENSRLVTSYFTHSSIITKTISNISLINCCISIKNPGQMSLGHLTKWKLVLHYIYFVVGSQIIQFSKPLSTPTPPPPKSNAGIVGLLWMNQCQHCVGGGWKRRWTERPYDAKVQSIPRLLTRIVGYFHARKSEWFPCFEGQFDDWQLVWQPR